MKNDGASTELILGSFTSATGLALGELLLLFGQPEGLDRWIAAIEIAARGTILASDVKSGETRKGSQSRSLASVAFHVVRAWHEGTDDLAGLAEAVQDLQEVLEAMGVQYVPAPYEESRVKE